MLFTEIIQFQTEKKKLKKNNKNNSKKSQTKKPNSNLQTTTEKFQPFYPIQNEYLETELFGLFLETHPTDHDV